MFGFFKELFSPVEEVTTSEELQSLSPEPLSRRDAARIALDINIGITRQKKKDKSGSHQD